MFDASIVTNTASDIVDDVVGGGDCIILNKTTIDVSYVYQHSQQ